MDAQLVLIKKEINALIAIKGVKIVQGLHVLHVLMDTIFIKMIVIPNVMILDRDILQWTINVYNAPKAVIYAMPLINARSV